MADGVTDGVIVIDKPAGWTSHDVVGKCRAIFGQKRIGHSGTLDPGATGVLLVGLGRATRLLRYLTDLPKTYECDVVLGTTTSTLDDDGKVTATFSMAVDAEQVAKAAAGLTGDIMQVPPMVSAIKIDGKRLHELAREGIEVERKPRPVTVYRYDTEPTDDPLVFRATVECSSGTYVRVLAQDLGEALGGGAHLKNLRRTAIGSFSVDDAITLAQIEADSTAGVLTAADALRDYESLAVDDERVMRIRQGKTLSDVAPVDAAGPWRMLDTGGELVAVFERVDGQFRSAVVLSAN